MKKSELKELIREVVREEVQKFLAESQKPTQVKESTEAWPTMNAKPMNTTDILANMRANFNAANGGNPNVGPVPTPLQTTQDVNGRPVSSDLLDPSLQKALSRDYTSLVKTLNKKKTGTHNPGMF